MSDSDHKYVLRTLSGDIEEFKYLVSKYEKKIYNLAYRMTSNYEDAMDITQTTFLKAYEKLDSFNPSFKFYSWLYRISINTSLNFIKKRKKTITVEEDMIPGVIVKMPQVNPELEYIDNERSTEVQKALARLREPLLILIILKHFVDLSYREIGKVLELPEKIVKSRLYSARQELKDILLERRKSND